MNPMRHTSSSSRRSGWTLIEMVLVVTATTVLSAVGISVIMLLMRMEQTGTVSLARQRATSSLALQLRADGHQSTNVELVTDDNAPTQVRLTLPEGGTVTWSAREGTVTRAVSDGDSESGRNAFHFPDCSARWTLTEDARHLSLHLSTDAATVTTSEPESVEAFETTIDVNLGRLSDLGRQLRFASTAVPENTSEAE
ncbi:hypothetical protein Mal4_43320 [Maioricimonas rarisocia]|uniref:Prepilin-type N-terminal cleavage/methylation domain-containing protein n=1 Tax=Maioricimonas rarisocia TaxID=2528026 RepID=A0A517ZBX4_9PLAN|nr:hypothetical protein [Maioricimonas rarisocia]QDU39978.1 hypothetical protein Mal4_43320 [Maioricimonas rarisocia]